MIETATERQTITKGKKKTGKRIVSKTQTDNRDILDSIVDLEIEGTQDTEQTFTQDDNTDSEQLTQKKEERYINPSFTSLTQNTKKTDRVVGRLLEGFQNDFTVEEACSYAGIHKDTYYTRLKDDKLLSDEVEKAKQFSFTQAKKALLKGISVNPELWLKRLSKRQPKLYADKQEVEHTWTVSLAGLYAKAIDASPIQQAIDGDIVEAIEVDNDTQ